MTKTSTRHMMRAGNGMARAAMSLLLSSALLFTGAAAPAFAGADELAQPTMSVEAPAEPEAPVAPTAPDVEGMDAVAANERIEAYNAEVDAYNELATLYNDAYASYLAEVDAYNAEVGTYNEQAAAYNEQAEAHNAIEQEAVDASDSRMAAYESALDVYTKNVAAIERIDANHTALITPQQEQLGDVYRYEDAESLAAAGTIQTESWTTKVGRREITVAKPGDLVIQVADLAPTTTRGTIAVEAGDPTEETYKVVNFHVFLDFDNNSSDQYYAYMDEHGWDCLNLNVRDDLGVIVIPAAVLDIMKLVEIEVAEVGGNDIVTVGSQRMLFGSGQNVTATRWIDGYTAGTGWIYTTEFQYLVDEMIYHDDNWLLDVYASTFRGPQVSTITNYNVYQWFNRYYNPEPVAPVAYEPNWMKPVDTLGSIFAEAISLNLLDHMDLLPIPVAPAAVTPQTPQAPQVIGSVDEGTPQAVASDSGAALAVASAPAAQVAATQAIADDATPMAAAPAAQGSWALVNLLLALLSALISVLTLVLYFARKRTEDEEDEVNRKGAIRVLNLVPAIAAIVLFILTEDMSLPITMVDGWTPFMVAFALVSGILALLSKKQVEENDDDSDENVQAPAFA